METTDHKQVKFKSKLQIILDVVIIVLVLFSLYYYATHLAYAKALISDPCKVCSDKTGAVCMIQNNFKRINTESSFNMTDTMRMFNKSMPLT